MIDRWMIARLESLCHRFQRWTGKTNFWLLRLCSVGIAFINMTMVMAFSLHTSPGWMKALFFPYRQSRAACVLHGIACLGYLLDAAWYAKRDEDEAFARLRRSLANPYKQFRLLRWLRHYALLLLVCGFGVWQMDVWTPLFTAWLYLHACDPLPPCASRLGEFFRTLGRATDSRLATRSSS
jgi:hypothetical protein